ncbi:MAG TPA: pseudouridine synthase [Thermoanaerobaculia bacterium]|nr:pseudouridine synthase [Thermoanaerobaculia bacterium]
MSEERLQKILARAGVAARRKAEELIRDGLVTINGQVAELGSKADPERDAIKVDGKRIHPSAAHRYLLLNKPKGVMSTVSDPEGRPTVIDLVPPGLRRALVPVGRLDFDTEGLLLLTDDGDFAQQVAHPRFGCTKTYEVKVKGRPEESQLERLRTGIVLDGRRTAPCRITPHSRTITATRRRGRFDDGDDNTTWWMVELNEGRTRQIREMFHRIGHPVQKLRRVAIGPVRDPRLPVGAVRELSEQEVEKLTKASGGPKPAPGAKKAPAKKVAAKKTAAKKGTAGTEAAKAEKRPRGERRTLAEVSRESSRAPKGPKVTAAGRKVMAGARKGAAPTAKATPAAKAGPRKGSPRTGGGAKDPAGPRSSGPRSGHGRG